ncbi:MAG TPA: trehalose-6-phosphate synthase [Ktedonobacterales bacterium]
MAGRGPDVQQQVTTSEKERIARLVGGRQVIVASNRGPVEFMPDAAGRLRSRRGSGGLVTALTALAGTLPLSWVAVAMSRGDRLAFPDASAAPREVRLGKQRLRVRLVNVPRDVYQRHYGEISNQLLWFLQHYLWDAARSPTVTEREYRAWDDGYAKVNAAIAEAVAAQAGESGSRAIVLLQDYHLYLAPAIVRRHLPRATIQQFVHIPWPAVRYWEFLPERFLRQIFESLVACDVVGFQTPTDARNFLLGAREVLPDCRVSFDSGRIVRGRHSTLARAYPITIDADEVRHVLDSTAGRAAERELAPLLGGEGVRLIVRVDRLEPTKNILRGLLAFEALLREHRDLHGTVRHLLFLVPSREGLEIYRRYARDVRRQIARINAEFGTPEWQPVTAFFENNRARGMVAMRHADVLLVNPVIDGMNLVVKEGAVVGERDPAIVLSRTAGSYLQLAPAVLPVTPTDLVETQAQLAEALAMPRDERHRLAAHARQIVLDESLTGWVMAQIRDAAQVRAPKPKAGARLAAHARAG